MPATSPNIQHTEWLEQSLGNRAGPSSNLDLAMSGEVPDAINALINAPFFPFPEDTLRYILLPNVSSSNESWQELLQLVEEQNRILINPVILTNSGPWEIEDEH
jgi:hypothetical protein